MNQFSEQGVDVVTDAWAIITCLVTQTVLI